MRSVQDVDALILMATTLSSKRRPAELVEIVAAADLQSAIPFVEKLGDAIRRLSVLGLIASVEGGFMLTPIGQQMMAKLPGGSVTEAQIAAIKCSLAAYISMEDCPPILLTREQLDAAIRAHKLARKSSGKNLLMPKPKLDRHFKVEGRWRRAAATREGKS